jgi:hypothetical protein
LNGNKYFGLFGTPSSKRIVAVTPPLFLHLPRYSIYNQHEAFKEERIEQNNTITTTTTKTHENKFDETFLLAFGIIIFLFCFRKYKKQILDPWN